MRIILASKSPRRSQILSDLGVNFEVITCDADEHSDSINPKDYVEDISREKGRVVAELVDDKDAFIISADTVVVLNDKILGKPKNRLDAIKMLALLSGKTHRVITAVTINFMGQTYTDSEITEVMFSEIEHFDIVKYVESGECMDKAGSYAVQGKGSIFIKGINGCYFNVVGFPTHLFVNMLKRIGINPCDVLNF